MNVNPNVNVNAEWHAKHRLPQIPTLDQRVTWHLDHARHCSCTPPDEDVLAEMRQRYANTHQEFWLLFSRADHRALALWAAACAEHVLPLFEGKYPADPRPREAIRTLREWVDTGTFRMPVLRAASLAAHAAAREVRPEDDAARFAARAAGQAVATAHVPTHGLGPALYAAKAVAANDPAHAGVAAAREREWQLECLPKNLREWVVAKLSQYQRPPLPPGFRSV